MKLNKLISQSEELVNQLIKEINLEQVNLKEAEEKILKFIYRIGHKMLEEIIGEIAEPTVENSLEVGGKVAKYKDNQNLRFKNRFGQEIIRNRRRYKIEGEALGYYPLDEKLGLDVCKGFSPLMTYLISFLGGSESYGVGAKILSKTLGFRVSETAVQSNTEGTGERIEHHPFKAIVGNTENESSDLMVVEIDGTMSPQIHEEGGITGRESLKQPTEYKECNIVAIEKISGKEKKKRRKWIGAQYGKRKYFENYVRQSGLKMGQMKAKEIVFIADGAKHNWEIQKTNFPKAIAILDFYHALEHLASFCELFKDEKSGKQHYSKWRKMLHEGEILQIIEDMKESRDKKVGNRDSAQKEINYFENNKWRMQYDLYREKGYPIGSGLVEGNCKLVVGKRFKGNGMRWKKRDNEAVLDVRLSVLNNDLDRYFEPKPREFRFVS